MFEVGKVYKRQEEIHGAYGGQRQGGISTPAGKPHVFIFTSSAGENYGYHDQFQPDGTFWYTGEGQVGDMEMLRGNLAIRDHVEDGKQLHLFEYVRKGHVSYVGECQCVGQHTQQRSDRDGNSRAVIIFHLVLLSEPADRVEDLGETSDVAPKLSRKLPLADLRELALRSATQKASPKRIVQNAAVRSKAIRLYALKRSNGICEGCTAPAPFQGKEGPFLEVHHLHRLSDDGPDHPANVIALCPNCHRRVHFGKDGAEYNNRLTVLVKDIEG